MDMKTALRLAEKTKTIVSRAYEGRTDIVEIAFPASLKEIGPGAFSGCENIQTIELPNGIEKICAKAFSGCRAKIYVPASIKFVGCGAFGKECEVFMECQEEDFIGFHDVRSDEPCCDSIHDGQEDVHYYQEGCKLHFGVPRKSFR